MSAVNNLSPLGIKTEDLNLLRNDRIKFDCGPLVYHTIIDWGFALPAGRKIKDHMNNLKIEKKIKEKCNVDLKKWMNKNESKISKDSFCDFDITTLHDFVPILCYDKVTQTGGQEYERQIKDPNSLESLLKEIKAFRNDVSHEYAEAVKDSHIGKMKETMRKCIRAAGKLYGKDQTEIDEKVKNLDNGFDKVLLETSNFYENRVNYIAQKISSEVPSNMLERYSPYFSVPLPGSSKKVDTSDIFQCSNLSVTTEDSKVKDENNKTIFPSNKFFNYKHNKFVVINGSAGSGKTTLMRNMCQDILQTSVHGSTSKYEKIEQFKIPIYLECRFEQQTNLAKFLRECLKNFLSPEDDIYEAFKIVKCLIFLIDGYDEINNNCRILVDSIITFCRDYDVSCIVSSRVDAGNNFINDLQDRNLNCTKMFIEPIYDMSEKVNFLRSLADMMDDSIDTDKLVNSFGNLTAAAKEVFSYPILFALFISLFMNDPDSVTQMKNEQSAFEAVRTCFLCEMTIKLRMINTPNARGKAEHVAYVLSKFCLQLFKAKKYFMEEKDYLKMIAECESIKGMPDDVNIPSLLSCILTPEQSFKFTNSTSYQFMHSSVQEYLAVKHVSKNIRELQDDRNSHSQTEDKQLQNLLRALELDESKSDIRKEIKRYGNIIKLLMLETLEIGEIAQYRSTFTKLLKKYFEPEDYFFDSPDYHLGLILSSNSNADIISIVSDCMRDWEKYDLEYYRHIKPMIEVVKNLKTGIQIDFSSREVTNTQEIIQLLTVLKGDSEIGLYLYHSHDNYQPLEDEFYTQLKNNQYKVSRFKACITSEEHLSIVVGVFRGEELSISTPSVCDINFAALEDYKWRLYLRVKYSDDCPSTGSNPVTGRTYLRIENIPADGKENVFKIIKYICSKSKIFNSINLHHCHLTDTDAKELLKQLHGEKIRTRRGERTEVIEMMVREDKSRYLRLQLRETIPEEGVKKLKQVTEVNEEEERRKLKTSKSKEKTFGNIFNRIFRKGQQ